MKNRNECVQYIVVRKDLVPQMGVGKTAAQVAHASLGIILDSRRDVSPYVEPGCIKHYYYEDHPYVQKWLDGRFIKLVVYVKSKEKLMNMAVKLDNDGIGVKLIYDACFTALEPEEENGTTLTCMGVIPIRRNMVPRYLKKLQLLD